MLTVEKLEINEGKKLYSRLWCYYNRSLRRTLQGSVIQLYIMEVRF